MTTIRLVHVTTIPETLGFLKGQIEFMRERGFEIVAVSAPGDYLDRFGRDERVPVFAVPMVRRVTPLQDLVALFRLAKTLRELRPTIVHSHTPKAGLLGTVAGVIAGVPVRVYHMRGMPLLTAAGPLKWALRWSEIVACAAAHRVICVSQSLRQLAIDERLCPPDKLKVLAGGSGNGVNVLRFDPVRAGAEARRRTRVRYGIPEDALVVGFLGRLTRDKGIRELLEAWGIVSAKFPSAHLLLGGALEDRDGISAEARRTIEADPRIHWKGHDWDSPPLYAAMDVLALPTYREGFPNVVLEAAAMELPVVATRVLGCVDAVADGVTGLLVPPRDGAALAAALARYLEDPELRRAHGRAGRRRVLESFTQEVIWRALADEYRALLETLAPSARASESAGAVDGGPREAAAS